MEVNAAQAHVHGRDSTGIVDRLDRVEHVLEGAFNVLTVGGVVTGLVAPMELATVASQKLLGAVVKGPEAEQVAHQGALGIHGLLNGLIGHDGLYEKAFARRAPALALPSRTSGSPLFNRVLGGRHGLHTAAHVVFGTIGAIQVVKAVQEGGPAALLRTRRGRGGLLQAVGGALSVMHHPYAQIGSAAMMGAAMLNELGAFGKDPESVEELPRTQPRAAGRFANPPGIGSRPLRTGSPSSPSALHAAQATGSPSTEESQHAGHEDH